MGIVIANGEAELDATTIFHRRSPSGVATFAAICNRRVKEMCVVIRTAALPVDRDGGFHAGRPVFLAGLGIAEIDRCVGRRDNDAVEEDLHTVGRGSAPWADDPGRGNREVEIEAEVCQGIVFIGFLLRRVRLKRAERSRRNTFIFATISVASVPHPRGNTRRKNEAYGV